MAVLINTSIFDITCSDCALPGRWTTRIVVSFDDITSLRWDGSHSAEVNENINLYYSQDQGFS